MRPKTSLMRFYIRLLLIAVFTLVTGACSGDGDLVQADRDWWPNGNLRREAQYQDEHLSGVYRTWYQDGQPYEIKHYVDGHEQGLQQAWSPQGDLYLNYEMWSGRRFGYVNVQPCYPVVEENVKP